MNNKQGYLKGRIRLLMISALMTVAIDASAVELGNNVTGTIGLNGESGFGTASVNGVRLQDTSGNFAVNVNTDEVFSISAGMGDFQDTNGSFFGHTINNLGPLVENELLDIDMRRDSGRIIGSVSVIGGSLERITMGSYATSGNETYTGSASGSATVDAIQPMAVASGVEVAAGAVVLSNGGCSVPFDLLPQYVDVVSGSDSFVSWTVDASHIDCSVGNLQGSVTLNGAPPRRTDLSRYEDEMYVGVTSNRSRRSTSDVDLDGSFSIDNLTIGRYSAFLSTADSFSAGELGLPTVHNAFTISGGTTATYDIEYDIATADGLIEFDGPWGVEEELISARGAWKSGGYTGPLFRPNYSIGTDAVAFQLLGTPGTWAPWASDNFSVKMTPHDAPSPYSYREVRFNSSQVTPIEIVFGQTGTIPTQIYQTSESLVAFELSENLKADGAVITELTYRSSDYSLRGTDYNILDEKPTHTMTVKGVPGTYQMTAEAKYYINGSFAGIVGGNFQLTLSEPVAVEVSEDAPLETFISPSGDEIGTIDFGQVIEAGSTTFSELTIGPDPEEGLSIYTENGTDAVYFDISSSATFTGDVQVCVQYDGTNLTDEEESALRLGHYVDGAWDDITDTDNGYPNIFTDTLCGLTPGFSYFAILVVEDSDGDDINDSLDNCPDTANPDQRDFDEDGYGDLCDTDTDNDGIINDSDLCPLLPSSENGDIDGDQIGDPCDYDKDGDTVENDDDNCPIIYNETQVDFDMDGLGDACDLDDDGDSVSDEFDQCPGTSYIGNVSFLEGEDAGCTSNQLFSKHCPIDGEYRNHGAYVSCVSDEADRQVDNGILHTNEHGAIVSSAAQSDVGKK